MSPTQFKIGDIVEAVVAFVCYPTQKGPIKMTMALRALSLLDHTERDVSILVLHADGRELTHQQEAAILRMRSKQKATSGMGTLSTLKRKSAYGHEDTDDTGMRFSRMRIDDEDGTGTGGSMD